MNKNFLNALDDWGGILTGTYERNATCVVPTKIVDGRLIIDSPKCKDNDSLKGIIEIPEGVEEVKQYTFSECNNITGVIFPESMRKVSYCAFSECENLSFVRFNEGLKELSWCSFSECPSLKTINIPDTLTVLATDAFSNCDLIGDLTIPGSVKYIGIGAFAENKNLNGTLTLQDGIIELSPFCFGECNFSGHLEIPKSVEVIGQSAFFQNKNITSLKLNEGLKFIHRSAFEGCSGLTGKLIIPRTLKQIEDDIFLDANFSVIHIPKELKNIFTGFKNWGNKLNSIQQPEIVYY